MKELDYKTIAEYINMYDGVARTFLDTAYKIIKDNAPDATEKISWAMPTFHQKENLIHFAVHKTHLGIYPGVEAIIFYSERLKDYVTSKGAIQFPYNKEFPTELLTDIVKFRVDTVISNQK